MHNQATIEAVAADWGGDSPGDLMNYVIAPPDYEWVSQYFDLFVETQIAMEAVPGPEPGAPNEQEGWDLWNQQRQAASLRVLKKLDAERLFGKGDARPFIFLHEGDFPEAEWLQKVAPELNPGTKWEKRFGLLP